MRYSRRSVPYRPPPGSSVRVNWNSPQAQGLAAWWPLRHPQNVARDFARGYDLSRDTQASADPTFGGSGVVGAHSIFTTNTGYHDPTSNNLPTYLRHTTDDHFIWSVWLNCGDMSGETNVPVIVGWYGGGTTNWILLRVYTNGGTREVYASLRSSADSSGTSVGWSQTNGDPLNTWHHFALKYDGDTRLPRWYMDGLLHGDNSAGALNTGGDFFDTTGDRMHIGNHPSDGGRNYIGGLCDIRIYTLDAPPTEQFIYDLWHPATRWDLYAEPFQPPGKYTGSVVGLPQDWIPVRR